MTSWSQSPEPNVLICSAILKGVGWTTFLGLDTTHWIPSFRPFGLLRHSASASVSDFPNQGGFSAKHHFGQLMRLRRFRGNGKVSLLALSRHHAKLLHKPWQNTRQTYYVYGQDLEPSLWDRMWAFALSCCVALGRWRWCQRLSHRWQLEKRSSHGSSISSRHLHFGGCAIWRWLKYTHTHREIKPLGEFSNRQIVPGEMWPLFSCQRSLHGDSYQISQTRQPAELRFEIPSPIANFCHLFDGTLREKYWRILE